MLRCSSLRSAASGARLLQLPRAQQIEQHTRRRWKGGRRHRFSTSVDGAVDGYVVGEAFRLVGAEERLWSACVDALRTRVPEAAWQSCFAVARPQSLAGNCLVLTVPSVLVRQRIEARYLEILRTTLAEVSPDVYDVRLEVSPDARHDDEDDEFEAELEFEPESAALPVAPRGDAHR